MQVNTKFLVCSLIYMGSLSANAVGSSSLANETVHVSILSADQTKNERNITGRIIDGDTGEAPLTRMLTPIRASPVSPSIIRPVMFRSFFV